MRETTQYAEVEVVFLPVSQGGRKQMPFLDDQRYRPHFRVPPSEELLGVEFVDGPDGAVSADTPTFATVRFVYEPEVCYEALKVGTEFEIVEGPHIVGRGKVTRR